MKTLVLSIGYEPLGIISWHRGLSLVYSKKAEAIELYDAVARSPTISIQIPSVIKINKYINPKTIEMRFNKLNVFTRDGGMCQYCLVVLSRSEATFDHVYPKSRGGRTGWTNIVTACYSCNQKKENKTLAASGMQLAKVPVKPLSTSLARFHIGISDTPSSWNKYVYNK